MNKKYIVFACALFACFGCLKDINAGENEVYELEQDATTESLKKLIKDEGDKIKNLNLRVHESIVFTNIDWSKCTQLESLDLSCTTLTTEGLKQILTGCPNLKNLNLSYCKSIDFTNIDWSKCKNIESLDLSLTAITAEGLKKILTGCPNLKNLNLSYCKSIVFTKINWSKCTQLESLDLTYTNIATEGLKKILTGCPNLKNLNLSQCKSIDFADKAIDWSKCKNIEKLNLPFTDITAEGLKKILIGCPRLKELKLSECENIDFINIDWSNCKNLNDLTLYCTDITTEGLKKILTGCPNLTKLYLLYCTKLDEKYRKEYKTQEAIEKLKKDLGIENPKSFPTHPIIPKKSEQPQKLSWLAAKWQGLSTSWKWTIGVGAVAIPVIGALIFYKRSQTIQNLSSALWRRLPGFLKRQKTVNFPLNAQHLYKI